MSKVICVEQQFYLTATKGYKGVHIFLIIINPKVNIILELEFKRENFEAAVQHFSH